jgi:hypothetical protein
MIIRPIYPGNIFKEPLHKGLLLGMLIVGGIFWITNIDILIGSIIFLFGVILYRYEISGMYENNRMAKKRK